jgi:REP element-mobilizing transposase RayT
MPRHPRLFVPRATYHVYCRVARGEYVFDSDEEAIEFVDVLRRVRDLDGLTILAWCLMANHYHLVVTTGDIDLWRSMARLQATVARNFNRQHRYLGRLWQSRYRARVITTDEYFRQVVAYVHLNPVSASIVDDPARYTFSGHREILGLCRPHILDRTAVLAAFSGDEVMSGVDEYLGWIRAVAEAKWAASPGLRELPWWESAVDDDEVADARESPDARTFDGQTLNEERRELSFDEFTDRFFALSGHQLEELRSRLRTARILTARIELATLALARYRLRTRDLADLLEKNRSTVTRWLNAGLKREREDDGFIRRLDTLDHAISSHETDNAPMRYVAP